MPTWIHKKDSFIVNPAETLCVIFWLWMRIEQCHDSPLNTWRGASDIWNAKNKKKTEAKTSFPGSLVVVRHLVHQWALSQVLNCRIHIYGQKGRRPKDIADKVSAKWLRRRCKKACLCCWQAVHAQILQVIYVTWMTPWTFTCIF